MIYIIKFRSPNLPVVVSQRAVEGQAQDLQLGKPKYPVLHASQRFPITFGRHWHWPPNFSHSKLRDPWKSHWHGIAPLLYADVMEKTASLQNPKKIIKPHVDRFLQMLTW